jgi:hypothetical protein
MKPTVWVTGPTFHDISKAKRFGEIKYISNEGLGKLDVGGMMRACEEVLGKESEPGDFLLISGMTVFCVCAALAMSRLHDQVNMLIHVNSATTGGDYRQRTLFLGEQI